jgi:hypothetical protein
LQGISDDVNGARCQRVSPDGSSRHVLATQKLMSSSLFIRSPKVDSRTITLRWVVDAPRAGAEVQEGLEVEVAEEVRAPSQDEARETAEGSATAVA